MNKYLKKIREAEERIKKNNLNLPPAEQRFFNAFKALQEWRERKSLLVKECGEEIYWRIYFNLDEEFSLANQNCLKLSSK